MQGTRMPDVEVLEGQEPMLVLYRRLIANSGGPGVFRGGMGLQEATILWSTDAMRGVVQSHCERVPPRGISGGMPGGGGRITMIRGSDVRAKLQAGEFRGVEGLESEALPSISDTTIGRDDVIVMSGGGGGGVGDPLRRDPQAVAVDLREDRITAGAATEVYGVEVDAAGELLIEGTEALRARLRRERLCAANAGPPSRAVTERGDPAVALVETDAGWLCAACGHHLSGCESDWREAAVTWTTSAAAALRGRGQMVRECAETEPVFERSSACGACGSLLLVEIGREAVAVEVAAAEVPESVRG
jgi:N-methylhydantoinase B